MDGVPLQLWGHEHQFLWGVLISDLQLLTAAHCVNGRTIDEVMVVIGSDNAEVELRKFNYRTLFKIELYPLYYKDMENAFKHSSDVAILTLDQPLVLNFKVNVICLPTFGEVEETYEEKTAIVAGWGKTEPGIIGETSMKQLMHVKVPVISNAQCKKFYTWVMRFSLENWFSFRYCYFFRLLSWSQHTEAGLRL